MDNNKITIYMLIATLLLVTAMACEADPSPSNSGGEKEIYGLDSEFNRIVLARVGDTEITIADLLLKPQVFQTIRTDLITQEIIRQDAARRGMSVSEDEIQAKVDEFMEMNGGRDEFMAQLPQSMPDTLVSADIRFYMEITVLKEKIIEQLYEEEHGPITDEERNETWEENKIMFSGQLAAELSIDVEAVTIDHAMDKVEELIETKWKSEHVNDYFVDLEENFDFEFYLLDQIESSTPSEPRDTTPEVPRLEVAVDDGEGHGEEGEPDDGHEETEASDEHGADDGHGH